MPVETRKRKAAAPTPKSLPAKQQLKNPTSSTNKTNSARVEYKDDDPFFNVFDNSSAGESDADDSDYEGNKRRKKVKTVVKKRKSAKKGPGPAPEAPEMSEDDFIDSDDDTTLVQDTTVDPVMSKGTNPGVLSIRIPPLSKTTSLNLNLADLFAQVGVQLNLKSAVTPTMLHDNTANAIESHMTCSSTTKSENKKVGFCDLPEELRNKVYHNVFVSDHPIVFSKRDNFSHAAHFLRTCRMVASEGACILYSKNSFHFSRTADSRGAYYDKVWKEIGFKDVRRFLHTIGPVNLGHLKYVSFNLEDAAPYLTPYVSSEAERRYVNDPILLEIFQMIGAQTVLSKLAMRFGGRAQVHSKDVHFLRALSKIKCNHFYRDTGYGDRIEDAALHNLKSVMLIKREKNVDKKKVKHVPMLYEKPNKSDFTASW